MIDTEAARKLVGGDQIRHIKSGRIYTVGDGYKIIWAGILKGEFLVDYYDDNARYARLDSDFGGFEIVQKVAE